MAAGSPDDPGRMDAMAVLGHPRHDAGSAVLRRWCTRIAAGRRIPGGTPPVAGCHVGRTRPRSLLPAAGHAGHRGPVTDTTAAATHFAAPDCHGSAPRGDTEPLAGRSHRHTSAAGTVTTPALEQTRPTHSLRSQRHSRHAWLDTPTTCRAAHYRDPAMFTDSSAADHGGLSSYSSNPTYDAKPRHHATTSDASHCRQDHPP
jgi:hypothetical protein